MTVTATIVSAHGTPRRPLCLAPLAIPSREAVLRRDATFPWLARRLLARAHHQLVVPIPRRFGPLASGWSLQAQMANPLVAVLAHRQRRAPDIGQHLHERPESRATPHLNVRDHSQPGSADHCCVLGLADRPRHHAGRHPALIRLEPSALGPPTDETGRTMHLNDEHPLGAAWVAKLVDGHRATPSERSHSAKAAVASSESQNQTAENALNRVYRGHGQGGQGGSEGGTGWRRR